FVGQRSPGRRAERLGHLAHRGGSDWRRQRHRGRHLRPDRARQHGAQLLVGGLHAEIFVGGQRLHLLLRFKRRDPAGNSGYVLSGNPPTLSFMEHASDSENAHAAAEAAEPVLGGLLKNPFVVSLITAALTFVGTLSAVQVRVGNLATQTEETRTM